MFTPMGMTDTSFYDKVDFYNWKMETADQYLTFLKHHTPFNVIPETSFEMGGQGIYSTLNDYKKFQMMLVNNGVFNNKVVFKSATIQNLVYKNLLPVSDVSKLIQVGSIAKGLGVAKVAWSAPGQLDVKTGNFGWAGFGGCSW